MSLAESKQGRARSTRGHVTCRPMLYACMTACLSLIAIRCVAQAGDSAGTGQAPTQPPASGTGQTVPGVKPPPVPTGVIPLPQGPPPTGLQSPLPAPAGRPPDPQRGLVVSPRLSELPAELRNRPLTINDAVALAEATSRSFASAVEALLRARAQVNAARAALNPTVAVNGQITEFDAPTTADLGAFLGGGSGSGSGSGAPSSFLIVPQFNPVFTATVGLPIDIAGNLRAAVSQAQFQEVAARIDINRVRNQVVLDVKNAFYNTLRAQAQAAVATDNLNNTLSRLSDAQKNYAAGTSPRFDVITAQRDVADAQQNLLQAKTQVSIDLALLKNVMGVEIRTPIKITDQGAVETPPGVEPPTVPPPPAGSPGPSGSGVPAEPQNLQTPEPMPVTQDLAVPKDASGRPLVGPPPSPSLVEDPIDFGPEYDSLLGEAIQNRPEVLEADAQIAAARKGIVIAEASSLPSFSISLSDTYTPDAAGFTRRNVGAATLGVSVPIFDGGLARARVQAARAEIATAETNRRQAVDQVGLDVQQAYLTLLQARNRVAVANVGLSQAREAARLARVRYNAGVSQQAGVSPILELSNAQNSLAQAQSNQVNALYDYNNARAQLDRAVGRYSYTATGPGYHGRPAERVIGGEPHP